MIRDVSKVLVIDTEHTCYDNEAFPFGEQSDIIQIGWCWLELPSLEISKPQFLFVKPTRSRVSEYCTELTGITPKQVTSAPPLAQVCKTLIKNGTKARPWMTWGYDIAGLQKECEELGVEQFPFSESYINAQDMASIILGFPLRMSLDQGLKLLDMSFKGTHHQAHDDAFNTARIIRHCCMPSEDRFDSQRIGVR